MNRLPLFAAALGLALLAASAAQAFTIDNRTAPNSDGAANATNPDSRFSGAGNSGTTTYRQGNTTLQFGTRPRGGDRYFNTDRMFNPNGRPEGER